MKEQDVNQLPISSFREKLHDLLDKLVKFMNALCFY